MIDPRREREGEKREGRRGEGSRRKKEEEEEEEEEERCALLPECFESPVVREQTRLHLRA
jgi:hypothetical protein